MRLEQQLADLVYSSDPLTRLTGPEFENTDRKQVSQFHSRLHKRLGQRLSAQFGGCLALLEEKTGRAHGEIAAVFASSPEYRSVREDVQDPMAETRFELAWLNFILRNFESEPTLLAEFSEIYLTELSLT